MTDPRSRYQAVTRRRFLAKVATAGAVILVPGLASCGTNDADVFAITPGAGATTATAPDSTLPTTTPLAATSTTTEQPTTTLPPASPASFPAGGELVVKFSYSPDPTIGNNQNPYIAVWIEDTDGELVATIDLWFLQSEKGTRWLRDLRRWASVDGSETTVNTISSATRSPGEYALAWNGTDVAGDAVELGNYFICIESAREKGQYSLIREPLVLGAEPFVTALPADGELTDASVSLVV